MVFTIIIILTKNVCSPSNFSNIIFFPNKTYGIICHNMIRLKVKEIIFKIVFEYDELVDNND